MSKPLILIKHLNVLPILTQSRNIHFIEWDKYLEYHIPLQNEVLKDKPKLIIENNILKIIYRKDGFNRYTDN